MNSQTTKITREEEDVEGEKERGEVRQSNPVSTVLMSDYREIADCDIGVICGNKNDDDKLSGAASTILISEDTEAPNRNACVVDSDRLLDSEHTNRSYSEPFMGEKSLEDLVSGPAKNTEPASDQQVDIVCEVDPFDIPLENVDGSYNYGLSQGSMTSVIPVTASMEISTPYEDIVSSVSVVSADNSETSKAESVRPVTGKKRRYQVLSDSENYESDECISQRLRSRKARAIEVTIDVDKDDLTSNTGIPSPCVVSMASETDGSTLLESDPESVAKKAGKGKKAKQAFSKKRASPIADKLHPVVETEQLSDYPTASLIAHALDWIDDIDMIRVKSSFQGVISKKVKERLEMIKACFNVMHQSSLGANDTSQLKIRNARLAADYYAAQQENLKLKQDMAKLKKDYENDMMTTSNRHKITRCSSTSPIPSDDTGKVSNKIDDEIMDIKNRIILLESNVNNRGKMVELPNAKPEESSIWKPLPQRQLKTKPIIKSIEKINPDKRVTIIAKPKTKYLPGELPGMSSAPAPFPGLTTDEGSNPETLVNLDADVQSNISGDPCLSAILTPNKEKKKGEDIKKKKPVYGEDTDGNESRGESNEQWKTVQRKKKKKSKNRNRKSDGEKSDSETQSGKEGAGRKINKSEKSAIQILQKKVPKASAVVIKGKTPDFSYADALIKMRKQIPLEEIGIHMTKIKKTNNGAVLIEIPGSDTKELARELCSRAANVLGEEVAVSCPEIKGEIRIVGFDESVGASDIAHGVSKAGGCKASEVTITPITPMRNGLCMTWVKCPIAAAIKASKAGKIPLGWTMARLELQKPRKLRCFKCWELGHHRNMCKSGVDRSKACYRCGVDGHPAVSCTNEAHCVLCESKGISARHRTGSHMCGQEPNIRARDEMTGLDRRPAVHNNLNDTDNPE